MEDRDIQIPETFAVWYGQAVVLARAPQHSLYMYSPEGFRELERKINENAAQHALTYPRFREFTRAGLLESRISEEGILTIPEVFYGFLGKGEGEIAVEASRGWLAVRRIGPDSCFCDDASCRKCLTRCRDELCELHARSRKAVDRYS